jgi:hypothetical protein
MLRFSFAKKGLFLNHKHLQSSVAPSSPFRYAIELLFATRLNPNTSVVIDLPRHYRRGTSSGGRAMINNINKNNVFTNPDLQLDPTSIQRR